MTKLSSTSRSFFITIAALAALATPAYALGSVHITEVMYDPSGADGGREWIQLTNTGDASVALAGYRLFEGGVNHKLTVVAGTSTLLAGEEAIIATDPGQYKADHPSFSGTLFKSSFSLSNSGETVELRDPSLATVDSYSYTAPPVVKAPAPAKATKSSKNKNIGPSYVSGDQAAAVSLPSLPSLPALPNVWLYGLGLALLLIVGAGAALYARPTNSVTSGSKEEFELE